MTTPGLPSELYDHVVRAVLAYERDGELALARELADAGEWANAVREHIQSLRESGLLQEPEQPDRIGDYRVLQRLGSGGMGTVFLCEQLQPVKRRVAVKVMRAGMDSAEIVARFRLEQRALASLDHAGIAALLDAGTTDAGRPFLVMEYVPGQQLHRYCDERQLDGRARLELFAKLCDAVQHAHHKGLVHRDLKPSNVLVLDRHGAPWPIVIDFGVAKSIGGATAGATILTLPGAMLGTPEYMSPEQATHELDIDTRADVYSLGVMLYELLTGTLPIAREQLHRGDVARVLGTFEPPTPSARITTLGATAESIADRRRTDVSGLRRLLRGDLDWVTMKALEKDRNRRYGMPAELAADVRSFLASEPVSAGPVGSWYRLKKLCAKNRAQTVAFAVALTTIAAGLVVSTWFWRDAAASSRASADSLDDALRAVGELVAVGDSELVDVPHLTEIRRGLLERSVAFYQHILERADQADPRLRPRIADALLRLGCLEAHLADHARAIATLRNADARAERLGDGVIPAALRARGLDALAEALDHTGDVAAAGEAAQRAVDLSRRAFELAPDPDIRASRMRALMRRSDQLAANDKDAALELANEAHDLGAAFVTDEHADHERWPLMIEAGATLARRLLDHGRREQALDRLDATFRHWQQASAAPRDAGRDWRLTLAVGAVAAQFARCDNHARMIEVLEATETMYARLAADHPTVPTYRTGLARTRRDKALAQLKSFRFRDGLASATTAEQDFTIALDAAPEDRVLLLDSAQAAVFLANAHLEARRQGAAFDLGLARAARERAAQRLDRCALAPSSARAAAELRLEERRLFALLHDDPRAPEVTAALAAAVALADELLRETNDDYALAERGIELRLRYGHALRDAGEPSLARPVLLQALERWRQLRGLLESHETWFLRGSTLLLELARVDAALGDTESVLALLDERVTIAVNEDWGGKLEVVRLALQFAARELRGDADRLLDRARGVVQLALRAGDAFERRGAPDASPAMLAMMRASTWALLVDVERLAGDARAEAMALGEVAACRAAAFGFGGDQRRGVELRKANDEWLSRVAELGDEALLLAAVARIAEWSATDAEAQCSAARVCGRYVVAHPGSEQARAAGRRLLDGAVRAGVDRAHLVDDPDLTVLGAR